MGIKPTFQFCLVFFQFLLEGALQSRDRISGLLRQQLNVLCSMTDKAIGLQGCQKLKKMQAHCVVSNLRAPSSQLSLAVSISI